MRPPVTVTPFPNLRRGCLRFSMGRFTATAAVACAGERGCVCVGGLCTGLRGPELSQLLLGLLSPQLLTGLCAPDDLLSPQARAQRGLSELGKDTARF